MEKSLLEISEEMLLNILKKAEKNEHVSEDERKKAEESAQKTTDKMIKEIDALVAKKEKEIMEV